MFFFNFIIWFIIYVFIFSGLVPLSLSDCSLLVEFISFLLYFIFSFLFRNFFTVYLFFFLLFNSSALSLSWGKMFRIAWRFPDIAHQEFIQWHNDVFEILLIVFCLPFWVLLSIKLTLLKNCPLWHQMSSMCGNVLSIIVQPITALARVIFTCMQLIAIELYLVFHHQTFCIVWVFSIKLMYWCSDLPYDLLKCWISWIWVLILQITCISFHTMKNNKKKSNCTISFLSLRGFLIHKMTLSLNS